MATSASKAGKLIRLKIGQFEFNVTNYHFETSKPLDKFNRVTAFATNAKASFVLEGTEKTTNLFEQYATSRKRFDAELVLYTPHGEGELVKTSFKDTSITYYAESYNNNDDMPYTVTVVLNAKQIDQNAGSLVFDQTDNFS